MRHVFLRALVRSAAGLTAVALFPLVERGTRIGWRHAKAATFSFLQSMSDASCAMRHGYREYRRASKTLRRAAGIKPKEKA